MTNFNNIQSTTELAQFVEALLKQHGIANESNSESWGETANRLRAAYDDLGDNTFAAACYDQNSIEDLTGLVADQADMDQWQIDEEEWLESVNNARLALIGDAIADTLDQAEARWFEIEG